MQFKLMKKARTHRKRVEIITSGVVQSIHVSARLCPHYFRAIPLLLVSSQNRKPHIWQPNYFIESKVCLLSSPLNDRLRKAYVDVPSPGNIVDTEEAGSRLFLWRRRPNMFFDLYRSATESPCQQSVTASQPKYKHLIVAKSRLWKISTTILDNLLVRVLLLSEKFFKIILTDKINMLT